MIWIAILFISISTIIGMTWGDPQPASSSVKIASSQSCVDTIEHLTATWDTALADLSHGSRSPPRAPADLIYRVVLLPIPTVVDRGEVCSTSSFLRGSSPDLLYKPLLSCDRASRSRLRTSE